MVKTNILEIAVEEIKNIEFTVSLCNSMLLPALLNADNHSSISPHKEEKCQGIREGYKGLPLISSIITHTAALRGINHLSKLRLHSLEKRWCKEKEEIRCLSYHENGERKEKIGINCIFQQMYKKASNDAEWEQI